MPPNPPGYFCLFKPILYVSSFLIKYFSLYFLYSSLLYLTCSRIVHIFVCVPLFVVLQFHFVSGSWMLQGVALKILFSRYWFSLVIDLQCLASIFVIDGILGQISQQIQVVVWLSVFFLWLFLVLCFLKPVLLYLTQC